VLIHADSIGYQVKAMVQQKSRGTGVKYMLAGGSMVAALGLFVDPSSLLTKIQADPEVCQEIVQPQASLSRETLSRLIAIPERTQQNQVRQVVAQPYCRLKSLKVRAGVTAQREVYPLEFDPGTWLIVLYEGEEYAGYDFSFRH